MRLLSRVKSFLRGLLHKQQIDAELDDEIRSTLELLTEQKFREGMNSKEARRAAWIELGGVEQVKERVRAARTGAWLETMVQDVRFGLRMLRKNPGFTAVAVITVALGIGANTTIFSFTDQVLLRDLPVPRPEQLVVLRSPGPSQGHCWSDIDDCAQSFSYPVYRDIRERATVFSGLLAYRQVDLNVSGHGATQTAHGELVSGNFFKTLEVRPELGRVFTASDETAPGANPVAVLSYGYWTRQFGADASVLNKSLVVNGVPLTIVGVARKGFFGVQIGSAPDIFIPVTSGGQTLSSAFTILEKAAEANASSVSPQPFFESVLGPGGTSLVYTNFSGAGGPLAEGNTAGIVNNLGLAPLNIGLTPQFLVNALATNLGSSSYNALFATLRKRLSNNLQFDFDYTYSHAIDNNSTVPHANGNFEPGVTTILCDATNAHACRGNSEFDQTHHITGYFVYDLPFGRGQRFAGNSGRLLNEAIGGWQLAGIETWNTGFALTADSGQSSTTSLASDPGEDFIGPKSALSSNVHVDNSSGAPVVQFFRDPATAIAAFTPALGLTVGTRDNLRGPHFSNLDVVAQKNFPLWNERYSLKFRAEAYNVFNHTNFALYDPTLTSPTTFGTITSEAGTEPSRVMQFALRFEF